MGFNYRMTNVQAALGLAQFEHFEEMIQRRRENANFYKHLLQNTPGIILPIEHHDVKNVYWMFAILVNKNFGLKRDQLMQRLLVKGIETRTFFIPLHQQPILKKMGLKFKNEYPVAENIAPRGMYLPSGSGLKKEEIEYIGRTIKDIQK